RWPRRLQGRLRGSDAALWSSPMVVRSPFVRCLRGCSRLEELPCPAHRLNRPQSFVAQGLPPERGTREADGGGLRPVIAEPAGKQPSKREEREAAAFEANRANRESGTGRGPMRRRARDCDTT